MSIEATGSRPPAPGELAAARELIAQMTNQRAESEARRQAADEATQKTQRRQQGAAALLLDIWA